MALSITIGADPELWLRDKSTGLIVSAHDKMPGTKDKPHEVPGGAIQVDGLAAEFNINPCQNAQEFSDTIAKVMSGLQGYVGTGFELVSEPTASFTPEYFKALPEFTRELGCVPDWNAWTGQLNPKPDGGLYTRAGGGHVHIGWGSGMDPDDPMHQEDCAVVARQMDYFLGMYSLYWDKDTGRRKMYGRAGCYRPKPYGMEYRTLSNTWLRSPKLQRWVFIAAQAGFSALVTDGVKVEDKLKDACVDVINNSEEWWTKRSLKLSEYTGLGAPPPLPKPKDPNAPKASFTDAHIRGALKAKYGYDSHMQAVYVAAAGDGNTTAIAQCNAALGVEYFPIDQ